MGGIFGGLFGNNNQSAPPGSFQSPPALNIPVEPVISPAAIWRGQAALPYTTSPFRTSDFGYGMWEPNSMGMQLPQFQQQQQQDPWAAALMGLLGPALMSPYSYMPPAADNANSRAAPPGVQPGMQGQGYSPFSMAGLTQAFGQQQQPQQIQSMGNTNKKQEGGK